MDKGREMKGRRLWGFAPSFQQELHHRNGLHKIETECIDGASICIDVLFHRIHAQHGRLSGPPSRSPQTLAQGGDGEGSPDLGYALDVSDIDPELQRGRADSRRRKPCCLQSPFEEGSMFSRQAGVVRIKFVGKMPLF